ncbi:MAG: hypothetical protein SGARI_006212, partial [Bacillariaceae sp.]
MNTYSAEIMFDTYALVQRLSKELQEKFPHLPPFHHLYHHDIGPVVFFANESQPLHAYLKQQYLLATMINNGTIAVEDLGVVSETMTEKQKGNNSTVRDHWTMRSSHLKAPPQQRTGNATATNGANHTTTGMQNITNNKAANSTMTFATTEQNPRQSSQQLFRPKKFSRHKHFLVQLFLTIPHNSLLWYHPKDKYSRKRQLNVTMEWLESIEQEASRQQELEEIGNEATAAVEISNMWTEFDETLQQYVNQTLTLLEMEPAIAWDFQIAIDPS